MNPIIFSPSEERADYTRVVNAVAAQMNISAAEFTTRFKIMPFLLKMAVYLNPSQNTYKLSPRKAVDNPAVPNTFLLDQNDFFAVTGIGLRIGKADFASNNYTNHGNYPALTYPDPNYFTGTGTSAGSEAAGLNTLLNGSLSIGVSGENVVDPLAVSELFYNPDLGYSAVANNLRNPSFGGGSPESRGIRRLSPNLILDAMADNDFTISLATGAKGNIDGSISTGTTDSGKRNVLYIVCEGWKIKNLAGGGVVCPVKA